MLSPKLMTKRNQSYFMKRVQAPNSSIKQETNLLSQTLQLGRHLRLAVLFVGLHFVGQLLLCHFTEVVVLLNGFLKHFFLMLTLLSELL